MKNGFLFVLTIVLCMNCLSCNGQSATANKKNERTAQAKKIQTIKLTKADFLTKIVNYETSPNEWNYLGDKPAIIDFYADWCGPCKTIAPFLEELAEEYNGRIYIYKIDVDKEQELAALFGINSIPVLLFIPMDDDPQIARGALPKNVIKQAIDEVLLDQNI